MAIYIVTNGEAAPRLVRAPNQAQALRHIVKPYTAKIPSQDELLAAYRKGIEVENANAEGETQ